MKSDTLIDAIGYISDEKIKEAKSTPIKRTVFSLKKAIAVAAAVILCLGVSVSALAAADVEPAYQLLYAVTPSFAQHLKPVRKSCVDNGIQLEVVSAYIHEDTAEILIAMKDLEGDRIDETIDLFDSYDIRNSADSSGTCHFESFDEETGIATFSILITQMNEKEISGDKVTFSVREFLSHKNDYEGVISGVELSKVSIQPDIKTDVIMRGGSYAEQPQGTVFLKPFASAVACPVEGAEVSAIGYVNGKLHVQMYYENILETDNHGWVWLEDEKGNTITCGYSESFWDDAHMGSYEEYVFDISYEELVSYELYGDFTTCGQPTKGNWQITFPMGDVQ